MTKLPPGMRLNAHPNPCPGGYTLDCYCKYDNDAHHWSPQHPSVMETFLGSTYGDTAAQARKRGWILHRDGTATCPKCARALKEM